VLVSRSSTAAVYLCRHAPWGAAASHLTCPELRRRRGGECAASGETRHVTLCLDTPFTHALPYPMDILFGCGLRVLVAGLVCWGCGVCVFGRGLWECRPWAQAMSVVRFPTDARPHYAPHTLPTTDSSQLAAHHPLYSLLYSLRATQVIGLNDGLIHGMLSSYATAHVPGPSYAIAHVPGPSHAIAHVPGPSYAIAHVPGPSYAIAHVPGPSYAPRGSIELPPTDAIPSVEHNSHGADLTPCRRKRWRSDLGGGPASGWT
jgi:hypothetical protein